jgi:hypothetical protein
LTERPNDAGDERYRPDRPEFTRRDWADASGVGGAVSSEPPAGAKQARRRRRFQAAALGLIGACCLAGVGMAWWVRPTAPPPESRNKEEPSGGLKLPGHLFRGWDKPDLVVVVSASQHGYLLPCGCSRPQKGGLERRYNFIQLLKDRGWPVVAVDLGDVPQKQGPASLPNVQGLIKYRYAMQAMKRMDYTAVGVGEYEASYPLDKALGEFALNDPKPRVLAANMTDREKNFPGEMESWKLAEVKSPLTVGVTALVGPLTAKKVADPAVKFQFGQATKPDLHDAASGSVEAVLKDMQQQKVDFPVLLYMGSPTKSKEEGFPAEAVACAQTYPQFPLLVALDDTDEPGGEPKIVTNKKTGTQSMIVAVGHKGKYVGVVGVWRTGKAAQPYAMKYELVEMSEDFTTPADQAANHPILKLMEDYTKELKRDNYLAKYGQSLHPSQAGVEGALPKYVGSDRCGDCHKSAYAVWKHTDHHDAYQTLVKAERPSNRQYDPECIVCHTVGFSFKGGFKDAESTPNLKDVGCESCHGPGSRHVNDPTNADWLKVMNPWQAPEKESAAEKKRRLGRIDHMCQQCHDPENDVNWTHGGFERNWPKVAHPTPPEEK